MSAGEDNQVFFYHQPRPCKVLNGQLRMRHYSFIPIHKDSFVKKRKQTTTIDTVTICFGVKI